MEKKRSPKSFKVKLGAHIKAAAPDHEITSNDHLKINVSIPPATAESEGNLIEISADELSKLTVEEAYFTQTNSLKYLHIRLVVGQFDKNTSGEKKAI